MDIVPPSEDNSQDSGEFAPDSRRMFNQVNNNNFGGAPENFGMGSVPVSQFDYQVNLFNAVSFLVYKHSCHLETGFKPILVLFS